MKINNHECCSASRHEESFKYCLRFFCKARQLQIRDMGFMLVRDCVCPVMQHWRALGLRGWTGEWEEGVRGWRWDHACSSDVGGRENALLRMLDLKSHLALSLFMEPEGGWRTGGRNWWDGLHFAYGATWLAYWAPYNTDSSHTKRLLRVKFFNAIHKYKHNYKHEY